MSSWLVGDLEERKAIYQTVSERVAEEVPMTFLYIRARVNGLAEDFMGFKKTSGRRITGIRKSGGSTAS